MSFKTLLAENVLMNDDKISEILNLIGYGLAKFDLKFVNEFGFKTKSAFHQYIVDIFGYIYVNTCTEQVSSSQ